MKQFLPFFSYLFHPLFIPIQGAFCFFLFNQNYYSEWQLALILLQILIVTVLIPLLIFIFLKQTGKVDSIMVSDVKQRKIPLIIQLFLIIFLIESSITQDRFPELYYFYLGGFCSTLLTLIAVYFNTKASIHLVGIVSLTLFVIGLSYHNQINLISTIAFLIAAIGFVAASRLIMKAHTLPEIGIGFLIGSCPQLALYYFWL